MQEVQISDNFAKLSESLYIAERNAREEVEKRAAIQKKIATKDKERTEDELMTTWLLDWSLLEYLIGYYFITWLVTAWSLMVSDWSLIGY